jgi:hypothetical protein
LKKVKIGAATKAMEAIKKESKTEVLLLKGAILVL